MRSFSIILDAAQERRPSAFNAGLSQSEGDIVIFLDADDVLLPHTVGRVVEAFCANPQAAKVQYRMQVIDAQRRRTDEIKPPRYLPLLSGDLRAHVLTFPDDLTRMATSGNAFAASVLWQIFPVPERPDGQGADWYLGAISPLFGPVLSFDWIGAYYRVHGSNLYNFSTLDLDRIRLSIDLMAFTHRHIGKFARELGLSDAPTDPNEVQSVDFLGHRLVSFKLDPARHPIQNERIWSLLGQSMTAVYHRFDVNLAMKLTYAAWFSAMALAPRPIARRLAEIFSSRKHAGS